MAYVNSYGSNEYTTAAQRKKQQLSRLAVSQQPVQTKAAATKTQTAQTQDPYAEYKAVLAQQYKAQKQAADAAYNSSKNSLDKAKTAALRDAYISYMLSLRNMPQITAAVGKGGYAQSLAAKQQLNYQNNRSSIQQSYLDNLGSLRAKKDSGLADIDNSYHSTLASLAKSTAGKSTKTTAAATASPQYTYTLAGTSYTAPQFVAHLKNMGMTQKEIANYMNAKGLTL